MPIESGKPLRVKGRLGFKFRVKDSLAKSSDYGMGVISQICKKFFRARLIHLWNGLDDRTVSVNPIVPFSGR